METFQGIGNEILKQKQLYKGHMESIEKIRHSHIYLEYYAKYSELSNNNLFGIWQILKDEEYRNTYPVAEIELIVCEDIASVRGFM